MDAVKFGRKHGSCVEAELWRRSLPKGATQADAWKLCKRGDWLVWQLATLPPEIFVTIRPGLFLATIKMITRAIHRGRRKLRGDRSALAVNWRRWARKWLSGEDRSLPTAETVWRASGPMWRAVMLVPWSAARLAAAIEAIDKTDGWESTVAIEVNEAVEVLGLGTPTRERQAQANDIRREIPEWPGE